MNDDDPDVTVPAIFATAPLEAKPVAPENNTPKVIDSYTDGTNNYYLLDAGHVESVYIATLGHIQYTGVPTNYSKKTTTISELTVSLT
jgi:hypothetical protein